MSVKGKELNMFQHKIEKKTYCQHGFNRIREKMFRINRNSLKKMRVYQNYKQRGPNLGH